MKTISTDINMRIHYTMTYEEAQLIARITEGYVALARHLTQDVSVRFPEKKEVLEERFRSLCEGMHTALQRCEETNEVFEGKRVAVKRDRLDYLEKQEQELKMLKKEKEEAEKAREAAKKAKEDAKKRPAHQHADDPDTAEVQHPNLSGEESST
jgi:hypothetical protein